MKLPATKKMHPPKPLRPMFNWYYARIYIKVRPERVFVWPEGDLAEEPTVHDAHLDEVRSGHVEEPPEDHGAAAARTRRPGTSGWSSWRARNRRAELDGPRRLPDRRPRSVSRADPSRQGDLDRGGARGPAAAGGARLPDRAPSRPGLHLAAQHAGPRRPDPRTEGLRGSCRAGSSADSRCPRAVEPLPGLRQEGPGLLPDLSPPDARAVELAPPRTRSSAGRARGPAFQGPAL